MCLAVHLCEKCLLAQVRSEEEVATRKKKRADYETWLRVKRAEKAKTAKLAKKIRGDKEVAKKRKDARDVAKYRVALFDFMPCLTAWPAHVNLDTDALRVRCRACQLLINTTYGTQDVIKLYNQRAGEGVQQVVVPEKHKVDHGDDAWTRVRSKHLFGI